MLKKTLAKNKEFLFLNHENKEELVYHDENQYINLIRKRKKLPALKKRTSSYKVKRESLIKNLANEFDKHLNLSSLLN